MEQKQKEKLNILLDQLSATSDFKKYFENGLLKRVKVYKQKKLWHFYIELEEILPSSVYKWFVHQLQQSFSNIVQTDVTIKTKNEIISEAEVKNYWKLFVNSLDSLPPAYEGFVKTQLPEIKDKKIIFYARNNGEASSLRKRLEERFFLFCKRSGLHGFTLEIEINNNEEKIKAFREEQKQEDMQIVKEAMEQQRKSKEENEKRRRNRRIQLGRKIDEPSIPIEMIQEEERSVTIQGYVFSADARKLRSGRYLLIVKLTDYTDSLEIKMFSNNDEEEEVFLNLKEGIWLKARGRVTTDKYTNELTLMANDIEQIAVEGRKDTSETKRIELHAHTTMSQLDAVVSPTNLIKQAAHWKHEAIAITDHANVHSFPEAYEASKKYGVKVIYGVEANVVDDGIPIAYNVTDQLIEEDTYVVFDVETTGLSAVYDKLIEIAGVKIKNGEIIDRYDSFINPHQKLSQTTINLTGITDDMVTDAPDVDKVLREFYEWIGNDTLVAHNASFDIGFLNVNLQKIGLNKLKNPIIDTLELARMLLPNLGNHRLNTLCDYFKIDLTQHHRAIYDAEATAFLLWKLIEKLLEKNIVNQMELNNHIGKNDAYKRGRPYHCTLLTKNEIGIKNLYKLVSLSHTDYFYRIPRIPRSLLEKYREGILIGSACEENELFETILQKSEEEAEQVAQFYDFLEVQPPENYKPLLNRDIVQTEGQIYEIIQKIIKIGKQLDIPVVATGNVHHIEEHEQIYREILIASQPGNPLNRTGLPNNSFRTTDEMLEAFSFLGDDLAYEIIVENSHKIAGKIENVSPLKEGLFTPNIEGAEEEIKEMTYKKAKEIYGDPLPSIVESRIERELSGIIENGFAVIYLISQKLVQKSLKDGYLVGSRGSVGSSLVATFTEITEVNPLPPHYVCKHCQYNEFITDGSYASGYDLPDKNCPKCNEVLEKDGQDIPFETFLGFKGDKVPDIDLNFSGDYQPFAHQYTKELFGEDYVFRAGTIGTIAERTAYGFVQGYASDNDLILKGAEIDRLVQGCTGVKRTTGQHPGGIIVVPSDKEIYDFTPIQYPADDRTSEWKTTHFDFHSIEDNLLKLDILGHDDPTVIRMLQDLSELDPRTVNITDEKVMSLFSSTEALGVKPEQIGCQVGTLGVPEFGTPFVRRMLEDTKPNTFGELVIISGLSHGTDVWLGNAQELINDGICELSEVIGCRDDIMVYLMQKGMDNALSFEIMESVRRGRGLTDEWIAEMKNHNVPDWYIESCQKIQYMFPKAHAVAYVLMAVRIAYFKVYYPLYFYAAYFSIRADDFELDTMVQGPEVVRERIKEIEQKGNDATTKEKNLLTVLEVTLEMLERGYRFQRVDLYKSEATEFVVDGDTLIPPFNAVDGLGTNAALNIVKVRKEGEFLSKEDLRERSRISKTVLQYLDQHGCLEGMEDENQLSLF